MVDTNALWWYIKSPDDLSAAAIEVFRMAESGDATILVPAIVVAELNFLSMKVGDPVPVQELFDRLSSLGWSELKPLGRTQLEYLDRLPEVSEMHDKLIAAEAIIEGVPLVTSDRVLRASPHVETIW